MGESENWKRRMGEEEKRRKGEQGGLAEQKGALAD